MEKLLVRLKTDFPVLSFIAGSRFAWSPAGSQVMYKYEVASDEASIWALLHEVGHAMLEHNNYQSDFELLQLEIAAWDKAKAIAQKYGHQVDPEHIEDCLDTYRDWLYQRSTCPTCTACSLQIDSKTYCCFNCDTSWEVSKSRLCRAYRRKQKEVLV